MSRSVHVSRAKFRKAFQANYSTDEERTRVLGKIIDEGMLKKTMKANARLKKQSKKAGLKPTQRVYAEDRAAASKKAVPSADAKDLVKRHNKAGYG
jgi:O-methyltransferase involved in polyketide biosynthesis